MIMMIILMKLSDGGEGRGWGEKKNFRTDLSSLPKNSRSTTGNDNKTTTANDDDDDKNNNNNYNNHNINIINSDTQ